MSEEKTEQPTPRKLKKARDKGEVFKSSEITQTVVFVALVGVAALGLRYWVPLLHAELQAWPLRIVQLAAAEPGEALPLLLQAGTTALWAVVLPLAAIFGTELVFGLLASGLQVRGVLSAEPMTPKAERLNPGANLKRLFSTRNAWDLVKTLVKVSLLGTALWVAVRAALPDWFGFLAHGGNATVLGTMLARTLLVLALMCLAIYVLAGGVDYGHQFYEYMKQQRMSKDELRREYKEIEGDPYVKGYRRALMRLMATEAPEGKLSGARVVVTNPTHYAVALAYDPLAGGLPSVVAKGVEKAALAIRREAQRLGVPLVENRPLARRLYAQVAVGHYIGNDVLADVARLLAQLPRLPPTATAGRGEVGVQRP
jgi:type III secretion protein U